MTGRRRRHPATFILHPSEVPHPSALGLSNHPVTQGERKMTSKRGIIGGLAAMAAAAIMAACATQTTPDGAGGANELGGVVTSANGPEAGVWVIAETAELPTKFAKIVVTDDRGRYLMPDLPK